MREPKFLAVICENEWMRGGLDKLCQTCRANLIGKINGEDLIFACTSIHFLMKSPWVEHALRHWPFHLWEVTDPPLCFVVVNTNWDIKYSNYTLIRDIPPRGTCPFRFLLKVDMHRNRPETSFWTSLQNQLPDWLPNTILP